MAAANASFWAAEVVCGCPDDSAGRLVPAEPAFPAGRTSANLEALVGLDPGSCCFAGVACTFFPFVSAPEERQAIDGKDCLGEGYLGTYIGFEDGFYYASPPLTP